MLNAIEMYNLDKPYTPIYLDPNHIYQMQALDKRIYDQLSASLRSKGQYVPDENLCLKGSVIFLNNPSGCMYVKESLE